MKVYNFPEDRSPVATYGMLVTDLLEAPVVHTGEWQSMDTTSSKPHATHELEDVSLVWDRIPPDIDSMFPAVDQIWADEHFLERVRGVPYNPAPSHIRWPYAVRGNGDHTDDAARFDHTYPERFWPKYAGANINRERANVGIRFRYGDLDDVVNLLLRHPLTRQAYLPVWFPEDTGAVDGQRVPCTLGYHFMQRKGRLTCRYYIRSCDVYRHLSNDVWLAAMLTKWIAREVSDRTKGQPVGLHFRPGGLLMHISSLHAFVGDVSRIKARLDGVLA